MVQEEEIVCTRNKQTKRQLIAEIIRFLLVGGCATAVDYIVFWLFDGIVFPWIAPHANGGLQTLFLTLSTGLGLRCMRLSAYSV